MFNLSDSQKKYIVFFITVGLFLFNYPYIANEEYIPHCLDTDTIGLLSISMVISFSIIFGVLGLFKFVTEDIKQYRYTLIKFLFLAAILSTTHIFFLNTINNIYC